MSTFAATDPAAYETFMGRWSLRLAGPFLAFAGVGPGQRVLDVGCGTGVATAAAADLGATAVVGLDPSEPYLDHARRYRSRPGVSYARGDARAMAFADAAFDAAVSTLVLDVVPDAAPIAREMRRVTRPGGVVASAVHDFRGAYAPIMMVLDTAAVLDRRARALRDEMLSHPLVWPGGQAALWREVGLAEVEEEPLVVPFDYASFDDYWATFLSGQGRSGSYVMSLDGAARGELRGHVRAAYLAGMADGPRSLSVIVRAARGIVPPGEP
jgi:SAM-dependent methyltransferase